MTTREKEEVNKKQKQIDEVRKILCSASRVAASMATELSLTSKTDADSTPRLLSSDSTTCSHSRDVATSSATALAGIRRNFSEPEAGYPAKKVRVTTPKVRRGRGRKALRQPSSGDTVGESKEFTPSRASLEHLLLAAGVEVSMHTVHVVLLP